MVDAPKPNSVRITTTQSGEQVEPISDERAAFFPATDPYTSAVDIGEIVKLEFDPRKFDSSTLTIQFDTPDDQKAKAEFDLQTLR